MFSMNRLSTAKRVQMVSMLVEGNSLRSVSRMADVSINTVTKLLVDLGTACAVYHDEHVRGLKAKRLQADEIWSFVGSKQKNVPAKKIGEYGDIWTWTGMDADSKLMVSYMVGPRTPPMAYEFMKDLASRVAGHTQLTTDGLHWYVDAVDNAFGIDVDYAMLTKHYGKGGAADASAAVRYSPSTIIGTTTEVIKGDPNPRHISTSYVERQNLTMRMGMRRFTRLTNGFSKKAENHGHAVALHFMHYNFAKRHTTLRVTPAMEAGLADHIWELEEIVALLDNSN
jgi:IS1 family transposase